MKQKYFKIVINYLKIRMGNFCERDTVAKQEIRVLLPEENERNLKEISFQKPMNIRKNFDSGEINRPLLISRYFKGPNGDIPIPIAICEEYSFETLKCLGSGGYGSVFEIERISDNKKIAMKRQTFDDAEGFHNIVKEINILYRLMDYGNIVEFIENYNDLYNNAIFIFMEKGDLTLKDILDKNPSGLPLQLIKQLLIDMVIGLSFAYKESVAHFDIKPHNILIFNTISRKELSYIHLNEQFDKMIFKLTDFGGGTLKINKSNNTRLREGMGFTPGFAAPEVKLASLENEKSEEEEENKNENALFDESKKNELNKDLDLPSLINFEKADIYSLAMTIFSCFRVKFSNKQFLNNKEAHDKDVENKVDKIQSPEEDLSWLKDLLRNMLKYDKNERYDLKQVLEKLGLELPKNKKELKKRKQKTLTLSQINDLPPPMIAQPIEYDFTFAEMLVIEAKKKIENFKTFNPNIMTNVINTRIAVASGMKYDRSSNLVFARNSQGLGEDNRKITLKYEKNGEIFKGFVEKGLRILEGIQIWPDQKVYSGGFRRDEISDEGIMVFPDKKIISGSWRNGLIEGGYEFDGEQFAYYGSFNSGCKYGKGIEFSLDGTTFDVEYGLGGKLMRREKWVNDQLIKFDQNSQGRSYKSSLGLSSNSYNNPDVPQLGANSFLSRPKSTLYSEMPPIREETEKESKGSFLNSKIEVHRTMAIIKYEEFLKIKELSNFREVLRKFSKNVLVGLKKKHIIPTNVLNIHFNY